MPTVDQSNLSRANEAVAANFFKTANFAQRSNFPLVGTFSHFRRFRCLVCNRSRLFLCFLFKRARACVPLNLAKSELLLTAALSLSLPEASQRTAKMLRVLIATLAIIACARAQSQCKLHTTCSTSSPSLQRLLLLLLLLLPPCFCSPSCSSFFPFFSFFISCNNSSSFVFHISTSALSHFCRSSFFPLCHLPHNR